MIRLLLVGLLLYGCGSKGVVPPSSSIGTGGGINYNDACNIYASNPDWMYASLEASQRWQVPIFIFLAFIHQESRFNPEARPRNSNGKLLSSAYGYAQALDNTWREYQQQSGNSSGRRNQFDDAVDFIGWYVLRVYRATGISKWDAAKLYLNYHEGIGGYKRGLHNNKPWLIKVADKVDARANRYHQQLRKCNIPIYIESDGSVPKQYRNGQVPDKPLSNKKIIWF